MLEGKNTIKIRGRPITPNPYFMDIFKKKENNNHNNPKQPPSVFEHYERYLQEVRKVFSDLPKENQFWLYNGENIENLYSMYKAFENMDSQLYAHHTANGKNDFAEWVNKVYNDAILYDSLLKCNNAEEAKEAVQKRVLMLQSDATDITKPKHNSIFSFFIHWKKEENEEIEKKIEEKKKRILISQIELELKEKQNIELHNKLNKHYDMLKDQEKLLSENSLKLKKKEETTGQQPLNEEDKLQMDANALAAEAKATIQKLEYNTSSTDSSNLNKSVGSSNPINPNNPNNVIPNIGITEGYPIQKNSYDTTSAVENQETSPIEISKMLNAAKGLYVDVENLKLLSPAEEIISKIQEQKLWLDKKLSELEVKKEAIDRITNDTISKMNNNATDKIDNDFMVNTTSLDKEEKDVKQIEVPIIQRSLEAPTIKKSLDEGIKELTMIKIEKLLETIVICLKNNDFNGAKDNLEKVKSYYDSVDHKSEEKNEFDKRMVLLKKMVLDAVDTNKL
jgi:hypothetical protein